MCLPQETSDHSKASTQTPRTDTDTAGSGAGLYNSCVVIDRDGACVGLYRQRRPQSGSAAAAASVGSDPDLPDLTDRGTDPWVSPSLQQIDRQTDTMCDLLS